MLNIVMFPTMIISLLVIQNIHTDSGKYGAINHRALKYIIHVAYLLALIIYSPIQIGVVFYSCVIPVENFILSTTSMESKIRVSAMFYQPLLIIKKFLLAVMIVYGRKSNQIMTLSFIFMLQIAWLGYIARYTPFKYRFANITCLVNESSIAILVFMELLRNLFYLQRSYSFFVLETLLHFPMGAIIITLIFIVYIALDTDWREFYITIIPYKLKIKMNFVRFKSYKHFGKFTKYDEAEPKNLTVIETSPSTLVLSKSTSNFHSYINS